MPMPVAHGLLGATLVAAVLPRAGARRYYLPLAAGAFLANAADLDFGLVFALHSRAWHRGITHSFVFALLVFLALFVSLGRRRAAKAFAYGLAYASHSLLDFATTKIGGGVELLWPFNAERFALGWRGLSELPSLLPSAEIVRALCVEFALFAPPLLALLLWRRRAAARAEDPEG